MIPVDMNSKIMESVSKDLYSHKDHRAITKSAKANI